MLLNQLNAVLIAPVFFFLGCVLFLLTFLCLLGFLMLDPSFLMIACIMFVLGYNSFRFASMIRK